MHSISSPRLLTTIALAAVALCTSAAASAETPFNQSSLAASVQVPAGNSVALETVGMGSITYECRARKDTADQFEWAFVGPDAKLMDRKGLQIGKYFGPPATWEAMDGSKVTGAQVAVSPNGAGNIPLQLVKANPASGMGAMQGLSYIQRVATMGGAAPAMPCAQPQAGQKQVVGYQADYIFWKAL
jgi:hypothetical protein